MCWAARRPGMTGVRIWSTLDDHADALMGRVGGAEGETLPAGAAASADVQAEIEAENEKIDRYQRHAGHVARMHASGQIGAIDIPRMLGDDEGDVTRLRAGWNGATVTGCRLQQATQQSAMSRRRRSGPRIRWRRPRPGRTTRSVLTRGELIADVEAGRLAVRSQPGAAPFGGDGAGDDDAPATGLPGLRPGGRDPGAVPADARRAAGHGQDHLAMTARHPQSGKFIAAADQDAALDGFGRWQPRNSAAKTGAAITRPLRASATRGLCPSTRAPALSRATRRPENLGARRPVPSESPGQDALPAAGGLSDAHVRLLAAAPRRRQRLDGPRGLPRWTRPRRWPWSPGTGARAVPARPADPSRPQ